MIEKLENLQECLNKLDKDFKKQLIDSKFYGERKQAIIWQIKAIKILQLSEDCWEDCLIDYYKEVKEILNETYLC